MKLAFRILSAVAALLAGGYFIYYTHRALAGQDLSSLLRPEVLLAGLVLLLFYSMLTPLTAIAWTWLLQALGQPTRLGVAAPIFAATQFGKYLPGNVAQHFGRVAMARVHGINTLTCVLSMGYETLFLLLACAHVSALTLLWAPPKALAQLPLGNHRAALVVILTLGVLVVMSFVPMLANLLARRRSRSFDQQQTQVHLLRPSWPVAFSCYLIQVLNFTLVGLGLWVVTLALAGEDGGVPGLVFMIGAFASSWVLGFLAPGAPAGLGVREAVLSIWLTGSLTGPEIVALVVMLRLATTVGDLINFAWGSILSARLRAGQKDAGQLELPHQHTRSRPP